MVDFQKLCDEYENLTFPQRVKDLADKSIKVFSRLSAMDIDLAAEKKTLAAFILGSIVNDGELNEMQYLLMYPSLMRVFGERYDFSDVKSLFESNLAANRNLEDNELQMLKLLSLVDDDVRRDIIAICIMVINVDGKIPSEEKQYIKNWHDFAELLNFLPL